jgi:hypothetical protein
MIVDRDNGTTQLGHASLPVSDSRETYQFEFRIDAMERRMREAGLPNEYFPFVGAFCTVHPSWNTLGENYNRYDAVCVLRGLRSMALLPAADLDRGDRFNDYLLRALELAGLLVRQSPHTSDLIVGVRDRVDAVERVFRERFNGGGVSAAYHRALGSALGYPESSIERFLGASPRSTRA